MRIDRKSVQINNSLYVPIRCGAVYDETENSPIAGDHTGNNISLKRDSFCEFTVQYWAWKNARADYYGLCHYRRYFSFSSKEYNRNRHGLVPCPMLTQRTMKQFGLLNENEMRRIITQYDLVIPQPAPVQKMSLSYGKAWTVRQLWEAHDGVFFEKKVIDRMFILIDRLAPQYSKSAREYFSGSFHWGNCCYIMTRVLFEELCNFQFPIMEAIENELDSTDYTVEMRRTPAYVGEMLFGIFVYHITNSNTLRVCQKQLVFFMETEKAESWGELVRWSIRCSLDKAMETVAGPLFPLGSKRREICKKIYFCLTRQGKWRR